MEIPKHVAEYMSKHGTNTGNKILFYLLLHLEPMTTKDISEAVGVSPKTINKVIRKLKKDGILQDNGIETQKRRLSIPGATIAETVPIPAPEDWGEKYDLLRERMELLEAQNKTMMEILVSIQHRMMTPDIPKVVTYMPEITQKMDSSSPETDPSYNSLAKLASLKKSLSLQPCEEFKALFGVQVPIGTDIDKVAEMVRRKKAGKIEHIKAPLEYLKYVEIPSVAIKTPAASVTPMTTCRPIPEMVDMKKIELAKKADEMWEKMGDGERKPFFDIGIRVKESRYKAPIETLARSEFKRQIFEQHGMAI
jgi:DNA-binding Lrp family transcriptional regulator